MMSSGSSLASTPDTSMFQRLDNSTSVQTKTQNSSSSRILDIPCKVCGDFSSGKHYNIFACDGCAGFFKRSIRRERKYSCKAKEVGSCIIDKVHRNQCRACRLRRCEQAGMNKDAVQHERGPRNSTLKKQQINYLTEAKARLMMAPAQSHVLNLTIGRSPSPKSPRMMDNVLHLLPHPLFYNNPSFSRFPTQPILPVSPPLIPQLALPSIQDEPAAICESAARLLFMNVQWARTLTSFITLPLEDQLSLLEHSWRDLFILGVAQFMPALDLSGHLLQSAALSSTFSIEVQDFHDVLIKLRQMTLDIHEFSYLRTVLLFRATTNLQDNEMRPKIRCLEERSKVLLLQDEHLSNLNNYMMTTYVDQPMRFTKLMLILPSMKKVSDYTIEELFFRKTIGTIPIVNIICDMYRNQALSR